MTDIKRRETVAAPGLEAVIASAENEKPGSVTSKPTRAGGFGLRRLASLMHMSNGKRWRCDVKTRPTSPAISRLFISQTIHIYIYIYSFSIQFMYIEFIFSF